MAAGAATDPGRLRTENQDAFLVEPPLFVVADGLGGHAGGRVASSLAIAEVRPRSSREKVDAASLKRAIDRANDAVWRRASSDDALAGMATTMTAVAIHGETALVAHVGDSRAYLLRDGDLRRLTTDHTVITELVAEGVLGAEAVTDHPRRHELTRAIGADPSVDVDFESVRLQAGDRLLLCSDGLTGMVADERIGMTLVGIVDPQQAADRLVELANEAGGEDNVTAVVVDPVVAPRRRSWSRGRAALVLAAALILAFAGLAAWGGFGGGSASPSQVVSTDAP